MGEVIQIQLGNCGNHVGCNFYELIADEHGLDPQGNYIGESLLQREKINTFFQPEISGSKYSARALLVDLDPSTIEPLKLNKLYKPENLICSKNGANNIWAIGHYTESWGILKNITERLRKEIEICDNFKGFQLISSIAGGTGGGLLSILLKTIKEEYPEKIVSTVSILPSNGVSEAAVSPYNTILSLPHLMEKADFCITVANDSLYNIIDKTLGLEIASFPDLNHLIAGALGIYTGPMRFMGPLPLDLERVVINMTPLEKLHFLSISISPLAAKLNSQFKTLSGFEIFQQMINPESFLSDIDFVGAKTLAIANIFRGHLGNKEIEGLCGRYSKKNIDFNKGFINEGCLVGHSSIPPKGVKVAGSCLVNNSGITKGLKEIVAKYVKLFQKKSFLHWFTGEGMDEMEFTEAGSNVNDLIKEYEEVK